MMFLRKFSKLVTVSYNNSFTENQNEAKDLLDDMIDELLINHLGNGQAQISSTEKK